MALEIRKEIVGLSVCFSIITTILVTLFLNSGVRIDEPFRYQGDHLSSLFYVKTIIDTGWFQENPFVGAPGVFYLYDYPLAADSLNFLLIKFLVLFSNRPIVVANCFFLLTFLLVSGSSYFACRLLEVQKAVSVAASVLYAFTPYRLSKSTDHLLLSGSYLIPLITIMLLWIMEEGEKGTAPDNGHVLKRRVCFFFVAAALTGTTGIYYAAFTCVFLFSIFIVNISTEQLSRHRTRLLFLPVVLILIIGGTIVLVFIPTFVYYHEFGTIDLVNRPLGSVEVYGLKIMNLLIPIRHHYVPVLASISKGYYKYFDLGANDSNVALGTIGSLGLVLLLITVLVNVKPSPTAQGGTIGLLSDRILRKLGFLTLVAILFSVVGGLASLTSFIGLSEIRVPQRIAIFIAFFSMLAVAVFFSNILNKKQIRSSLPMCTTICLVIVLGVMDQTGTRSFLPGEKKLSSIRDEVSNDVALNRGIRDLMPKNSSIFQVPQIGFPEVPCCERMGPYDHLRGYLSSGREFHWSYPVIKDREAFKWQKNATAGTTSELISSIRKQGFDGLYIDRYGYKDNARSLETEVSKLTNSKPLVSPNDRFAFYDIR